MQEEQFAAWLLVDREMKPQSAVTRISACKRVTHYDGDLDTHYNADGLAGLMDRLNARRPQHGIPTNGNVYRDTTALKAEFQLYRDFRDARDRAGWIKGPLLKKRQQLLANERPQAALPIWRRMADATQIEFAQMVTPFVQFLEPGIVRAVADDWSTTIGSAVNDNWFCDALGDNTGIEQGVTLQFKEWRPAHSRSGWCLRSHSE